MVSPASVFEHDGQRLHALALNTPVPRAAQHPWEVWARPSIPHPPGLHAAAAEAERQFTQVARASM